MNRIVFKNPDLFRPSLKGHTLPQLYDYKQSGVWPSLKYGELSRELNQHAPIQKVRRHFKKVGWKWNDYFKFTVVRNPYSWAVSRYFYNQQKIAKGNICPLNYDNVMSRFKDKSFRDFVEHGEFHYLDMISPRKWNQVDFVIRLENFQEDFDTVCDRLGVPRQKVIHNNKSKHRHYTEYYDDETREIIAEKSKKELELFGYAFGQ